MACWQLRCQLAQPREKQCDVPTRRFVEFPLNPPQHCAVQSPAGAPGLLFFSVQLTLFKSISVPHLCDGWRCCCQCVRKCRKALTTKCRRPCLWLLEAGLIDALMLGADVSMLKCSQRSGVCGAAWLPLVHAAATRVAAATVRLRER